MPTTQTTRDEDDVLDSGLSAHFFEMVGNPKPEGGHIGVVETRDGFKLRYARWDSIAKPTKGTVLLLHGRTEFIEKYFETVSDLQAQGFAVLTFDWRGQGGSSRHTGNSRKGYVESYDEYGTDLETIFDQVLMPDCRPPYFVLSHSMGGLIALYHAKILARQVSRMVLCAPFLGFADLPLPTGFVNFLGGIFMAVGLGEMFATGGERPEERRAFATNMLTSDPARFDRNRKLMMNSGELGLGGPTVAWTRATITAQKIVNDPEYYSTIRIPTLIIGGALDGVTSNPHLEKFCESMRAGSLIMLGGAKHELMQETDVIREQIWAAFNAFVPGSEA